MTSLAQDSELQIGKKLIHGTIAACSWLLLVAGVSTAVVTGWLIIIGYSPTPYSDQWAFLVDLWQGKHWSSLAWLWQQHNEHRIPLSRVSVFADLAFFGGRSIFLFALTYLVLVLHWLLWAFFFWRGARLPKLLWLSVSGFFAFCLFCPSQNENLYWAFQWAFIATFFFASVSFLSLVWCSTAGRPWQGIVLSCIAAFLAESCLANGVLTWPILWVTAFWLPLQKKAKVSLIVIGTAAICLYFYGYKSPVYHSDPFETLRQPDLITQYLLNYFGHCLSMFVTYPNLVCFTLALGGMIAVVYLLYDETTKVTGMALGMTMVFLLGTGLITALGRIKFGLDQAYASRYQTPVMLFWACVFAAMVVVASKLRLWRDVITLNIAGSLVILLPFPELAVLANRLKDRKQQFDSIGESLDQGAEDPQLQNYLGVALGPVYVGTQYLHRINLTVGPKPDKDLPRRLFEGSRVDQTNCEGWLDGVTPLRRFYPGPHELRVEGWAVDVRRHRPVEEIAIVDQTGKVLANTVPHVARPDVLAVRPNVSGPVGWRIYSPVSRESKELRAFSVVGDHSCLIGKYQIPTAYKLINKASGKVIQVASSSSSLPNGTTLQQAEFHSFDNQEWQLVPIEDHLYKIVNVGTEKVIDVRAASTANGAEIQQFDYLGGSNQKWSLVPTTAGYYKIIGKGSGKALDIAGHTSAADAVIDQSSYTGSDSQQWQITPKPEN